MVFIILYWLKEDAIKSRSISDEQVAKRRRLNDETKAYIEEKLSLKWSL